MLDAECCISLIGTRCILGGTTALPSPVAASVEGKPFMSVVQSADRRKFRGVS